MEKRTYSDRKEYLKLAVLKRRRRLKQLAVEYKGGKCSKCGYDKCVRALEFHHLDPELKSFGLSAHGMTRAWAVVKTELDKTILVCANCHRELEEKFDVG